MNKQLPLLSKLLLSILILAAYSCGNEQTETQADVSQERDDLHQRLFEKVPASRSNILFANNLKEDVSTIENLFDFDYFYNGAGVGVEDLNNDGLLDIFFAGNQVPNALYMNKGDLVFEDVSQESGINTNKVWANGVTFVDINQDGWMDIYVSQGGPKRDYDRANLLYINQGDGTFKEEAEAFGLDDKGISTQSVFFDYDGDGDLDCFVSNENEFYGLDPRTFFNQMEVRPNDLARSSVHMYRNDGGRFTQVTSEAGMLTPSFGLGVTAGDIDNDGLIDVYVANDYYVPDALFVNQGNGTFLNRIKDYTKQVTFYGMGVDVADINNDGLQDIYVLDMASSDHVRSKTLMASMNTSRFSLLVDYFEMPYQYMFNSLQINQGGNRFSNAVQYTKMAKTDWSWAGLMADLDLDGNKDVYVTNGYRRYALDNDSQIMVRQAKEAYQGQVPLEVKQRLYDALPSEKLSNILFHNTGELHFNNETAKWGFLEPSFSNGAAYGDLDNDGDLDLVINNIDEVAFLYRNNSVEREMGNFLKVVTKGLTSEPFAKVHIHVGDQQQFIETKRVKGYLSATSNDAHFGLGDAEIVDTVRVIWPNGRMEERYNVSANSTLEFDQSQATAVYQYPDPSIGLFAETVVPGLRFDHEENQYDDFAREVLLPYKQSTFGPYMAKGDLNGDDREDIWIGGASGQPGAIFLQTESGFTRSAQPALRADAAHEDMEAVFFDADGDSDLDLFVVSGGNEFERGSAVYSDRLYLNDGNGTFSRKNDAVLAGLTESGKSVISLDLDQDGDDDLVVGNRIVPQQYPVAAVSHVLRNNGGSFDLVTDEVAPDFANFGVVNSLLATDFDRDGQMDFIAVAEWGGIGMFRNEGQKFTNVSAQYGMDQELGWWFKVAETDLNGDGFSDYLFGNMGGNMKFKASADKPFKVFGNDFDQNGTYDIVLSKQYKDKEVPVRGRECSSQQMPFITEKFQSYNAFANASLQDIYGEGLNDAYTAEMNTFDSMVLLGRPEGGYEKQVLPTEAQLFPLMDAVFTDLDGDGFQDAILAGNIYNTEVETPRMDMGSGLVLMGGSNGYSTLAPPQAALYLEGNVKSLLMVDGPAGSKLLLGGANDGALQVRNIDQ